MAAREFALDSCNVYIRLNWSDAWTLREDLICLNLTLTLGNAIDSADILFRSGEILEIGSPGFLTIAPIDLEGWYVKVEPLMSPQTPWVGFIVGESKDSFGAKDEGTGLMVYGADQVFSAVGIEYLLDRRQVITAVHYGTPEYRTQRPIGFNMGFGSGRDSSQMPKGNKDTRLGTSGIASFSEDFSHAEEWTAENCVRYLLEFQGPSDATYSASQPAIVPDLLHFASYLSWFTPIVPLEGRTVLAVLREIISPRRGLVWWLQYNLLDNNLELHINSVAQANVSLPGSVTLPAAHSQISIDTDVDPTIANVRFGKDRTNKYDRIRVRGARRVSVCTLSPADGNIVEGWNTSVYEGDYRAANSLTTAEAADRYRRAESFAHVYTRFLIASNWDGQSRDGSGAGTFEFACPQMPQGSTSIVDTEQFTISGLRLLRTLPLRQGWDYTTAASPVANDGSNDPAEFMLPFAIIKHGSKWLPMDRAAGQLDEGTTGSPRLKNSYNLRILDTTPGVEIVAQGAMPHALAKNHFNTGTPAPSKTKVEVDYEDMRLTLALEWDAYCEGFHPDTNPATSPLEELVINIGERARLDYLAAGTVFDVEDTTIKTVTTGGPLRDDRQLCRQIAQVAYEWYQLPRVSFTMQFHTTNYGAELGDFVTVFGSGATLRTALSTITQIQHDFMAGKTTFSGGFEELDFAGIA